MQIKFGKFFHYTKIKFKFSCAHFISANENFCLLFDCNNNDFICFENAVAKYSYT